MGRGLANEFPPTEMHSHQDLCTCSSLWISADECGSQTVDEYSSASLAIVVYAAALTGLVQSLRFLRMKSIVLLALETVVNVLGPLYVSSLEKWAEGW
jgi:hypothetical protein